MPALFFSVSSNDHFPHIASQLTIPHTQHGSGVIMIFASPCACEPTTNLPHYEHKPHRNTLYSIKCRVTFNESTQISYDSLTLYKAINVTYASVWVCDKGHPPVLDKEIDHTHDSSSHRISGNTTPRPSDRAGRGFYPKRRKRSTWWMYEVSLCNSR